MTTTTTAGEGKFAYEPVLRSHCDQRDVLGLPSMDKESALVKVRFGLVLVCKYWYDIGISLWLSQKYLSKVRLGVGTGGLQDYNYPT